jgi:hypothetical protein
LGHRRITAVVTSAPKLIVMAMNFQRARRMPKK